MWHRVVEILVQQGIPVLLNERSHFCDDLPVRKVFPPFPELVELIADSSCVSCGNTGPMWLAAAVGAPSVICESRQVAMPEYSAHHSRLAGLRYIAPQPDAEDIADRIARVYRDVNG
jgi:ADP-heptose:LPS heptosyltransferase